MSGKRNEIMSKMKYKIALAAAAVLLLGGVIYIYFAHYAPFKPDEAQTLSVWYVMMMPCGRALTPCAASITKQTERIAA